MCFRDLFSPIHSLYYGEMRYQLVDLSETKFPSSSPLTLEKLVVADPTKLGRVLSFFLGKPRYSVGRLLENLEALFPQTREQNAAILQNLETIKNNLFSKEEERPLLHRVRMDQILRRWQSPQGESIPEKTVTQHALDHMGTTYGVNAVAKAMASWNGVDWNQLFSSTNPLELSEKQLEALAERAEKWKGYTDGKSSKDYHFESAQKMVEAMNNRAYPEAKPELLELDFHQLVAIKLAYSRLWKKEMKKKQDEVGGFPQGEEPSLLTPYWIPDYKVVQEIRNEKGLRILVAVPNEKGEGSPLMICRGTAKDKKRYPLAENLMDDFSENIGKMSYSASESVIADALRKVSAEYGPVTLLGHSLGGAVAAQIYADHCTGKIPFGGDHGESPVIGKMTHFGAPGSGPEAAQKVKEKKQQLLPGQSLPPINGYFHEKDLVWCFGGEFLEGTTPHFFGAQDDVGVAHAHSKPDLLSMYRERKDWRSLESFSDLQAEKRRKYTRRAGRVRRLLKGVIFPYLQKQMAFRKRTRVLKGQLHGLRDPALSPSFS